MLWAALGRLFLSFGFLLLLLLIVFCFFGFGTPDHCPPPPAARRRPPPPAADRRSPRLEQWQVDEFKAIFKLYDKNGDGQLSCDELVDAVGGSDTVFTPSHVRDMFRQADKDGNDLLDLAEFIEMFGGASSTFV